MQTTPPFHLRSTAYTLPASVIALFFLLMLALLVGVRFIVHLVVEGRVTQLDPRPQGGP